MIKKIKEAIEDGIIMRKQVGVDEVRNIIGRSVLYRDDSATKLTTIKI